MINWLRGLLRRWFTKRDCAKVKIPKPICLEELRRLRADHVKLISQGVYMFEGKFFDKNVDINVNNGSMVSHTEQDKKPAQVLKFKLRESTINPDFDNLDSAEFEVGQVVQRSITNASF